MTPHFETGIYLGWAEQLKRVRRNMAVPVSTHQVESAVLQVKEDALWTQIKALAFDKLAPNKVLATKWTEGGENQGARRRFNAPRVWRACDCVTGVSASRLKH